MATLSAGADWSGWAGVRICLAVLLAPVVPLMIVGSVTLLLAGWEEMPGLKFFALFYLSFSYFAVLFIALPFTFFLHRRGRLSVPLLTAAGGLFGLVVWSAFRMIFAFMLGSTQSIAWSGIDFVWAVGFGVSIALPFALIAGAPLRRSARGQAAA